MLSDFVRGLFHFHNVGHENWFYFSMIVLLASLIVCLLRKYRNHFFYIAGFHILTSFEAFNKIVVCKQISGLYSIDYIWFNGLLFIIYVAMYLATKHICEAGT